MTDSIRLIGAPSTLFRGTTPEQRQDLGQSFDPDVYLITDDEESVAGAQQLEYNLYGNAPLLYPSRSDTEGAEHTRINGIDIVTCTSVNELRDISRFEQHDIIDTRTETIIISDLLSLDISLGDLNTTLDGLDEYVTALSPDDLAGSYTHVSTAIDAGYVHEWGDLLVRGGGNGTENNTTREFVDLTIYEDGIVTTDTIDPNKLGLQAIQNVGPKTAERLRSHGLNTVEAIANSDIATLTDIPHIGESKATTIKQSATALHDGKIIATADTPVPADDPVFIDIETDGLNPTSVWLIGVKNGIDGNYMSFIETDADPSGTAVENFIMWYSANASHKTLLAWNGWNFDFPVLHEHIQKHAPQYLDDWERASKRDPLRWARDLNGGNAILPGRTNKLEDVAQGLGWTGHNTGLDGAEVARRYRQWVENPGPETELDWERHKQYCRDDVEAMEFIFKHMQEATRTTASAANHDRPTDNNTSQERLIDF